MTTIENHRQFIWPLFNADLFVEYPEPEILRIDASNRVSPVRYSRDTPQKFCSLNKIYASCNFALCASDPEYFDDAASSEIWQKAMAEEMLASQMTHGSWWNYQKGKISSVA